MSFTNGVSILGLFHLAAIMSEIKKYLVNKKGLRASVVLATDVVQEIVRRQNANAVAAMALGRVTTGVALLACHLKQGQKVSVSIDGDGILGQIYAEAHHEGPVRALVQNPQALPQTEITSLGEAVGAGTLTVTTFLPRAREPRQGIINLVNGEIGEDLAAYLHQSQQQLGCLLALGVKLDQAGQVVAAGGILIEVLPGLQDESCFAKLEAAHQKAGSLSLNLAAGMSADDIAAMYLSDFDYLAVPHPFTMSFACPCSEDRIIRSISLLPEADWQEIQEEAVPVKGRCEFCGKSYEVPVAKIAAYKNKQ